MTARAFRGQEGFTLVETILAITILAVALVPLMNLFAHGAEKNRLVYDVVAAGLAASKMEDLIANRALEGWTAFTASPTTYQAVDSTNFPGYQWKVAVDKVSQNDFNQVLGVGSNTRFKRVMVYLLKPDGREITLTTVVTDY